MNGGADPIWAIPERDEAKASELAREVGISPLTAQVLLNRGIRGKEQAGRFLSADLGDLFDPFLLNDMERAIIRIKQAITRGERMRVYGDYDADGITATALLFRELARRGACVDYYVPNRLFEGYGLNKEAIELAHRDGIGLLVTVDCGVASCEEIELARGLGMDVIVTDHHEPPERLPDASAIINPKLPASSYPERDLTGVGIAFKLICALDIAEGLGDSKFEDYLDLAALGTIADVAPLLGENRVIVKHGLQRLGARSRPGIAALLEVSRLGTGGISPGHVAFSLAPRINAVGRLGDPQVAVGLLLEDSPAAAIEGARALDEQNQRRQAIEAQILSEALSLIESQVDIENDPVIVLAKEGWHPGVIGIVASRIVETFYRPTILITLEGEVGRGSGRSVPGFHLYEAILSCRDLLGKFGGHELACGLSIDRGNIDAFRRRLIEAGSHILKEEVLVPRTSADAIVEPDELNRELAIELARLEPFGVGNPSPTFVSSGLRILGYMAVGSDAKHLRLRLEKGGKTLDAIAFNMGGFADVIFGDDIETLDMLFSLELDEWNGKGTLSLNVKDMRARGPIMR